jgi:hypothetical protein
VGRRHSLGDLTFRLADSEVTVQNAAGSPSRPWASARTIPAGSMPPSSPSRTPYASTGAITVPLQWAMTEHNLYDTLATL